MRKFVSLFLSLFLVLGLFSYPISSKAQNILYQGYNEEIEVRTTSNTTRIGLRIKDGKGKDGNDNIVYCYDQNMSYPTSEHATYGGEDDRCYYSRIDNYLESSDPYTEKYGKEKKQKIALALYVGYPHDGYGDYESCFKDRVTPDEARIMTQNLIWDITLDNLGKYTPDKRYSQAMCDYYNHIYGEYIESFYEGAEFFPAKPNIKGDMTLKKDNSSGQWVSGLLYISGIKGSPVDIELSANDQDMKLYSFDHNGDVVLVDNTSFLIVGIPFFIATPNKPTQQKIELRWTTQAAKFYFYKHEKGGKNVTGGETNVQNLIRVEPYTQRGNITYHLKNDGTTEEIVDTILDIQVKKEWSEPPKANEKINVHIFADGEKLFYHELSSENNWETTFHVPERNSYGNKIKYDVLECPVPIGYSSSISGNAADGFVITNTKEKTSVSVKKEWIGDKASSVTVYLLADGVKTGKSAVLTEDNSWQYTFSNLDQKKTDGNEIKYTVEEEPIDGYKVTISGSADREFLITNSQIIIGNNDIEFEENTTPEGEHGSLPDGTITETEEESGSNSENIEFEENTTPEGEHGSLPDDTITETEEDTSNSKSDPEPESESKSEPQPESEPESESESKSKPKPESELKPNLDSDAEHTPEQNPTTNDKIHTKDDEKDKLDNVPDTYDITNIKKYLSFSIIFIFIALLINRNNGK